MLATNELFMKIIGITGTLGAGKGTIVEYLTKEYGFVHFSVRDFLLEEIKKRKLIANRDTMVMIANELRADNSPSYIVDKLYENALKSKCNCIIESIRTLGEVVSLRNIGDFTLFAVDASPPIRYKRIVLRDSETDRIAYNTFLENEEREMNSTDPNKQNLRKCIDMADFVFSNNTSKEDLYAQLFTVLNKMVLS